MTSRFGGGQRPPNRPSMPQQGQPQPQPQGLGGEYLKNDYFDAKGNLWPGLVVEESYRVARILGEGGQLKTAQLRRFFGKARNIQQKLDAGRSFESLVAEIRGLQPHAANAVARGHATQVFKEFIDKNVALAARDAKHFVSGFLVHFESIVCYFTYQNPSKS